MTKEELLSRLDEAETNEEIAETGRELLALDPESPYGKLAVWETMEYEEAMQNLDIAARGSGQNPRPSSRRAKFRRSLTTTATRWSTRQL